MPFRRPSGSYDSIRQAAAARSSDAVAMRRDAHAQVAESMRSYLAREQKWPATHEQERHNAATELLEDDVAAGRARIERPSFARLRASIAEQQMDWAWQSSPAIAKARGRRERREAGLTRAGFSARALWLGGIAFALLAAGMISAVATIQSSRPLRFETWAPRDLMPRAEGMHVAPRYDAIMALAAVGAARPEPVDAPAFANRASAEIDAALAPPGRLEPSDIYIAGVGPILASAATAKEFAARLATRSLPGVIIASRAERLLPGPPRPAFKPTLVSSRGEPAAPPRPATMP
jgi:hypothetical protein